MIISKFPPSPTLAKLIKCYYYLESDTDQMIHDTYFADGCIEAVFSQGWSFYKENNKEDWAKIIGQIIKPRELKIVGRGKSFGIWFYPHGFSRLSDLQMFELNDCVVSWDVLFPGSFAEFVGNCLQEGQVDKLIKGADDFLMKRLSGFSERSMDRFAEYAIGYLYQHKSASDLDRMALGLGVSQRYLQKVFLAKIGFSQKLFIRMIRFQEILQKLRQCQASNLAVLACEHDFFDQSHFVREFKAFTGIRPSQFDPKKLPINQHFIVPD